MSQFLSFSLPWQQRRMDHIRHALPADRFDGERSILQAEAVGGDLFEREPAGGDLLERQFAGTIAVAERALDGDCFHGELLQWEVRELLHLALDQQRAGLALERLDAEQDRIGPCSRGTVERD